MMTETKATPEDDARLIDEAAARAKREDEDFAERQAIGEELRNPYLEAWRREALNARLREIERDALANRVLANGVLCKPLGPPPAGWEEKVKAIDAELEALPRFEHAKREELIAKKLKVYEERR